MKRKIRLLQLSEASLSCSRSTYNRVFIWNADLSKSFTNRSLKKVGTELGSLIFFQTRITLALEAHRGDLYANRINVKLSLFCWQVFINPLEQRRGQNIVLGFEPEPSRSVVQSSTT